MNVSGKILLFILILSGLFALRCGAAVYNSNGTAESIQFFHDNRAQNGDTITLPPGIFLWTTGVAISKTITLQGAGVGSTIIKDAVQSGQLLRVTLAAGHLTRITEIEFQNGGRAGRSSEILHVNGSNTNGSTFRFDHCKWNNLNGASLFDTVIGVIDHNTFVVGGGSYLPINIYGTTWNGHNYGDGSWNAPTGYGTSQFLFIEDNTF